MFHSWFSVNWFIQQFPGVADPWITFLLKIAGVTTLLIVPISNIIIEHRRHRRAERAAEAARAAEIEASRTAIPPRVLSPMMSGLSDALTADGLRSDMMKLNGDILVLAAIARELLDVLAKIQAQGASEPPQAPEKPFEGVDIPPGVVAG